MNVNKEKLPNWMQFFMAQFQEQTLLSCVCSFLFMAVISFCFQKLKKKTKTEDLQSLKCGYNHQFPFYLVPQYVNSALAAPFI